MISTLHLHEYFLFEHHQERQREMEQQRFPARQPRKQFRLIHRLAAMEGGLLFVWGPNLKRLEASHEQVAYEQ
jgi:succinylarginine dihydrolase